MYYIYIWHIRAIPTYRVYRLYENIIEPVPLLGYRSVPGELNHLSECVSVTVVSELAVGWPFSRRSAEHNAMYTCSTIP